MPEKPTKLSSAGTTRGAQRDKLRTPKRVPSTPPVVPAALCDLETSTDFTIAEEAHSWPFEALGYPEHPTVRCYRDSPTRLRTTISRIPGNTRPCPLEAIDDSRVLRRRNTKAKAIMAPGVVAAGGIRGDKVWLVPRAFRR
jgi:hypothetical protein